LKTSPTAYSYVRFSTREQCHGDSLRRQTEATAAWCARNGVHLDTSTTFRDLGKSAYLGEHRKNPDRHALAAFLKMVEEGRIPRGSCLIIESLDRLTREHVRAGLMLCLGLIEHGVRVVQLSPTELVYDEKSDEMSLMLMIVELSRGHRESKRKSDVIGPAWRKKKEAARQGKIVTRQLPAWVEVRGGRLALVPGKAETVRLLFRLSAAGYGNQRIVARLVKDKVPPLGAAPWERSYVGKILRDRRALGEYQPRGKGRKPDGDPVPGYFPPVVSEEEFNASRAGVVQRKAAARGRVGGQVNVFAKLIRDAVDGGTYYMTARVDRGNRYYVLANLNSAEGRARCRSVSYPAFERAVLSLLSEVKPHQVMGRDDGPDEVQVLGGELARVEAKIAELEAELLNGDVAALARVLRDQEGRKRDLAARLADARQKAAHPLGEVWGQTHTLLSVIDGAPDPDDVRVRLRSALRRVVEEIWVLVVPRGLARLVAVQVYFAGDGHRDYLIFYRPPHHTPRGRQPGQLWYRSLKADVVAPGELDLRDRAHAAALAGKLASLELSRLESATAGR
jgi:DNA invertase Pin-like site-specific DNA recombinase